MYALIKQIVSENRSTYCVEVSVKCDEIILDKKLRYLRTFDKYLALLDSFESSSVKATLASRWGTFLCFDGVPVVKAMCPSPVVMISHSCVFLRGASVRTPSLSRNPRSQAAALAPTAPIAIFHFEIF